MTHRLILKLKFTNSVSVPNFMQKYRRAMNAFIVTHSKTFFKNHSEDTTKLFTFSNPNPIIGREFKKDQVISIFVSSIQKEAIEELYSCLQKIKHIQLGEGKLELFKIIPIKFTKIREFDIIDTYTPIVITLSREDKVYSLTYKENQEEFLAQLSKSMIKKYNFYNNTDIPLDFEVLYNTQVSLKGTYSVPLGFDNSFVVGSSLQIQLNDISNIQKRILTLNYLTGFGEKTSLGFGCMNKVEYTRR